MQRCIVLLAALLVLFLCGATACAEDFQQAQQDISGEIVSALPDDTADALVSSGITPENGAQISFEGVISALWQLILEKLQSPLKLAAGLTGVVMLAALSKSMAQGSDSGMVRVFTAVGVLAGAAMSISSVAECISGISSILQDCAAFMLTFIPIYAGVLAVLGKAATANVINVTVLAATQLFSQLVVNLLMPLCGTVLGLSVTGAVHPELCTEKLGEQIKKLVIWSLSLLMTIFMGILSMQTFSANAADNVLIRTAKMAVSSGVPIVGGTISDAVSTLAGSIGLLKSTVGTYGIAAAAVMIAPSFITAAGYKLALAVVQTVADIFGVKELAGLFGSCGSVMSILIAVMSCFLLMNVIAIIIMLALGSGL